MNGWDWLVLLGAFVVIQASESVLLYASTALANVGLKPRRFVAAAALTALVWAGCCGVALLVGPGQPPAFRSWATAVAIGGLVVSWLVPALAFARIFSTSAWRGLLVSTYQLLLRALTGLVVGATAVLLLRLFLAVSALAAGD